MLFDFPLNAWILLAVEFAERLAYYGVAFSLTTYCVTMLNMSAGEANYVVNGLYAVSPLAACISGGLSDGTWGRRRCLLVFGIIYTIGLAFVATSSLPAMYGDFPDEPSSASTALLVIGMIVFAAGYGGMKVCTSPLMADCVVAEMNHQPKIQQKQQELESVNDSELVLGRLFRYAYWVINFGSLFGIIAAPFLRAVDERRKADGADDDTTGYYYGFWMCAASTSCGMILFGFRYKHFPTNPVCRPFVMFRILWRAVCVRCSLVAGYITDEKLVAEAKTFTAFVQFAALGVSNNPISTLTGDGSRGCSARELVPETNESSSLLACASAEEEHGAEEGEHLDGATSPSQRRASTSVSMFAPAAVESLRQTIAACRIFLPLPIYWLLSNQFSTNVVLLANSMYLPAGIPPEVFNNVNTLTVLIGVVVLDKCILPCLYPKPHLPSVVWRMVAGFVLSMSSMVVCACIQLFVDDRGSYDSSGDYELSSGKEKLHAAWLTIPYMLQGGASVLVDTTAMESAYTLSSPEFKSSVMALYLLASSASGFLGLAIAPFIAPTKMSSVFFFLAALQGVVAVLFASFVREPKRRAAVSISKTEFLEFAESV